MTRVCLDSNVLVAAFVSRGLCADLLRHVLSEYTLVVPEAVTEEVFRVLRGKLGFSPDALEAVEAVLSRCERLPIGNDPSPIPLGDPDDERILADAIRGGADVMVTGDSDFLSAASRSPIPILSPRAFMTLTRGGTR